MTIARRLEILDSVTTHFQNLLDKQKGNNVIRLFCVTMYIVNKAGDKCLCMNHKKLGKWMPPGGKIDPNELPDSAAIRECLEETGVSVTLLGETAPIDGGLIRPYGMQLNTVIPGQKEHIDFIYLAVAQESTELSLNTQESFGVAWIPVEDILTREFNTFDSVKTWVKLLSREYVANYRSHLV
jgi:ADP-ribose pyrophosphatase YjhB (NUDIX family)